MLQSLENLRLKALGMSILSAKGISFFSVSFVKQRYQLRGLKNSSHDVSTTDHFKYTFSKFQSYRRSNLSMVSH